MTAELSLIHAYRHMYRGLLRAVQYASPARYVVRDQVRQAFRDKKGTLDREAIKRTIWFLEAAAKERGLEHKILKNLVFVHTTRKPEAWRTVYNETMHKQKHKPIDEKPFNLEHYDMTLAMLNKSMGLCLR